MDAASLRKWKLLYGLVVVVFTIGLGLVIFKPGPDVRITYTYSTDSVTMAKVENVTDSPIYNLSIEPWGYLLKQSENRLKEVERNAVAFPAAIYDGNQPFLDPGSNWTVRIVAPHDAIREIRVRGSFSETGEPTKLRADVDIKPE